MTSDERALELYRLALSLVETKGRFVPVGLVATKEYKVLTVNFHKGSAHVTHYIPGEWEEELEAAATLIPRGGEGTSKL